MPYHTLLVHQQVAHLKLSVHLHVSSVQLIVHLQSLVLIPVIVDRFASIAVIPDEIVL